MRLRQKLVSLSEGGTPPFTQLAHTHTLHTFHPTAAATFVVPFGPSPAVLSSFSSSFSSSLPPLRFLSSYPSTQGHNRVGPQPSVVACIRTPPVVALRLSCVARDTADAALSDGVPSSPSKLSQKALAARTNAATSAASADAERLDDAPPPSILELDPGMKASCTLLR